MNGLLMIVTGLAGVGLLLLLWALRGRRVGSEPRCRRCDYELTGLEHATCPECGTDHSDVPPRVGTRKRRKGAIVVGAVLLAITAAGCVSLGRKVDWYVHLPVRALIWLADGGDARAIGKLQSRFIAGDLSAGTIERLATMCLAKQALATVAAPWQEWIDLLERLDTGGKLTSEQQETYYRQAVGAHQFTARNPMAARQRLIAEFTYLSRGPTAGLSTRTVHGDELFIDDDPASAFDSRSRSSGSGVREVHTRLFGPRQRPGTHEASYVLDIRVGRGFDLLDEGAGTELTRVTIAGAARFTVLDHGPSDVTLLTEGAMATELRKAIRVVQLDSQSLPWLRYLADRSGRARGGRFWGIRVDAAGPMPVSVAFDVSARDGDTDHPIGTFHCRAGSTTCEFEGTESLAHLDPAERPIVLRTSVDVARATVDLHEIWDGELIFDPIRVGRFDGLSPDVLRTLAPAGP